MNENINLVQEREYIDLFNTKHTDYKYIDSAKRQIVITKSDNLIETIYIIDSDNVYKFTNSIGPFPQYVIDNNDICLILSNI